MLAQLAACDAAVPDLLKRAEVFEFDTKVFPFRECVEHLLMREITSAGDEVDKEDFESNAQELKVRPTLFRFCGRESLCF